MGRQGAYIVLEGIDGAGTTTHARLLAEKLSSLGYCVELVEEPSKGPVGGLIRHFLRHGPFIQHYMTLLFAADRLVQYETVIRDRLEKGCIVVSDRSWVSSLAYQSCDCFPGYVDVEWIYTINRYAPRPDVLVYIDVDPVVALRRLAGRGRVAELPERLTVLRELRRRYETILKLVERVVKVVIRVEGCKDGAERSVESVSRDIVARVLAALLYMDVKPDTMRGLFSH